MAKTKRTYITPEMIASYPYLVKPRANDEGKESWSCVLIGLKGTDLKPLKQLCLDALKERFGEDAKDKVKQKKLHWPFHDDPDEVAGNGYPEGSTYFTAVNYNHQPGTVNTIRNAEGKPTTVDPKVIYPGAIVRASLDVFCFERPGKKGVSLGLRNLQFIRDGERLDSFKKAEDEFEATEDAPVARLEDSDEDDPNADSLDDIL